MKKLYVMAVVMFVLLICNISGATIITVSGNVDDGADFTTIQDAIDASSNGDEIIVHPGTYTNIGSWVFNPNGKAIWIHSSAGANTTVVSGEGLRRVAWISNGETSTTIIEGFTFTYGLGGLFCASSPKLLDCVFANNVNPGGSGGGVYCSTGSPIFENCSFYENAAGTGGGLSLSAGVVTLLNCVFSGNTATYGGGAVDMSFGSPILTGCIFTSNSATNYGGAIRINSSCAPTISDCTFTSNTASGGGAVSNELCTSILNNCDFDSNSSTGGATDLMSGGAIANYIGHVELDDCTFTTNTSYYGGGLWNYKGTAELTNCDFDSNTAQQGGGVFNSHSSAVMSGCALDNNTALDYTGYTGGGAIYNSSSSISLTDCSLDNNSADNGGGMFSRVSTEPTIMINCSVTNNTAKTKGGGLYCNHSGTIVKNCNSIGNVATQGQGVYLLSYSMYKFIGTNVSDEIFMRNWSQPDASLVLDTDSTCDVTGDVSTSIGGSTHFDINNLSADEQLKVSNNFFRQGALGITNNTGTLLDSSVSVGDIIPLAQAATLSGVFSSVTFPIMPSGLGLQLIEQSAIRSEDTEVAVEVVEVEEAEFSSPFTGDLDSTPLDVESFDANGDGIDEIVVLFDGAPGGIVCFDISVDGAPVQIAGFTSTVGNSPVDLDVADLNGDGYDDVIVANGASNTVSVLTTVVGTDGALSFDPEVVLAVSASSTCISVIDWDGDAKLDAVVGIDTAESTLQDGYRVLLDVAGDDSLGPWFSISMVTVDEETIPNPPTCVDGGELTDSWGFVGSTQYGVTHRANSSISLQEIAELGSNTTTIEALHLNGTGSDNPIDLMVASDEAEMIYLFEGNAEASYGFDDLIPIAVSEPVEDMLSLDADFDGDMDIVMLSPSSDTPLVLLRNGNSTNGFVAMGSTWSKQEMESGETLAKIASGDLDDRDEDDDWITAVGSDDGDGMFRDAHVGVIERTNVLREASTCVSDLNADGSVNVHDILILIGEWGATNSIADLNGDGTVNVHDLLILVGDWGACD
jgi:predicted outer membrane repeat protein